MILTVTGSRTTGDGLKVSYHIIYPWLVFPSNTTMLHDEVGAMSEMPQFQYTTANGESKSFIDPGVYTSDRQFRLLLCNKLSDRSRTALRISSPPTIALFTRSCITHIEGVAGWIPQETIPRVTTRKSSTKNQHLVRRERSGGAAPEAPAPLCAFLRQLLHKQGHSSGALTLVSTTRSELKFRWQAGSLPAFSARV